MQCARCLADTASVVAKAPDGSGAWEMFYCARCNFSWRSSDEDQYTDPAKREKTFQYEGLDLKTLPTVMPIAPLRKQGD